MNDTTVTTPNELDIRIERVARCAARARLLRSGPIRS